MQNCLALGCPQGYNCDRGLCMPVIADDVEDKCPLMRCAAGYTCLNSRCISNTR